MKVDMSPEAVTRRLKQTSELRRLCLALGYKRYVDFKKNLPIISCHCEPKAKQSQGIAASSDIKSESSQ
jgi:hypothetical protein